MVDEITPAADATAKPADAKTVEAAPATDTKVQTQTAEATTKADSHDQSDAKIASEKSEKKEDKAPAEKPVVPEKYELKASEKSLLDASEISAIEAYAKEQGMSAEQAQKLLLREEQNKTSFIQNQHEAQKEAIHQTHRSWAEELATDKEFGGPKLKETAEHAKRFLDKYGDDDLRKTLNDKVMRWGDNPMLLRAFARAGRAMGPDKLVTEGKAGESPKTRSGNVLDRAKGSLYGATHNKE